jgi:hypothetical protein
MVEHKSDEDCHKCCLTNVPDKRDAHIVSDEENIRKKQFVLNSSKIDDKKLHKSDISVHVA